MGEHQITLHQQPVLKNQGTAAIKHEAVIGRHLARENEIAMGGLNPAMGIRLIEQRSEHDPDVRRHQHARFQGFNGIAAERVVGRGRGKCGFHLGSAKMFVFSNLAIKFAE